MNNIINETFTKHLGLLQQHLKLRLSEGKMKDLAIDLEDMSDDEFKRKHGKSKSEIKAMLAMKEDVDDDDDGYDSRRDARHSRDGYVHTGPRQKTNFQKMFPSSSSTVKKLYFYNVPSGKNSEATNMGLRQTKSGKWYSPKPNDIATKEFGSPKEWSPKN